MIQLSQESLTGLLMEQIRNSQEETYSVSKFTIQNSLTYTTYATVNSVY